MEWQAFLKEEQAERNEEWRWCYNTYSTYVNGKRWENIVYAQKYVSIFPTFNQTSPLGIIRRYILFVFILFVRSLYNLSLSLSLCLVSSIYPTLLFSHNIYIDVRIYSVTGDNNFLHHIYIHTYSKSTLHTCTCM